MGLTLQDGVQALPGIGEARARGLGKLGLATVEDLLQRLAEAEETPWTF